MGAMSAALAIWGEGGETPAGVEVDIAYSVGGGAVVGLLEMVLGPEVQVTGQDIEHPKNPIANTQTKHRKRKRSQAAETTPKKAYTTLTVAISSSSIQ
jgi:hypothetical protein